MRAVCDFFFSPFLVRSHQRFGEVGQQIRFKDLLLRGIHIGQVGQQKKSGSKRCIPRLDAQLLLGDRFEVIDMSRPLKMVCVFSL